MFLCTCIRYYCEKDHNHNSKFERVSTDHNQELTVFLVDCFLREMIDHGVGGFILTTTNLIYPGQARRTIEGRLDIFSEQNMIVRGT